MPIRPAVLDDTHAICRLFRSQIDRWQRINDAGQVEDVQPDDLTIYERWLHGGAWASIETGAIWLSHLKRVGAMSLVQIADDHITAYAEIYPGEEPPPYDKHLHLGQLVTHPDHANPDELMKFILQEAQSYGRITASSSAYDTAQAEFYQRHALLPHVQIRQYRVPAQTGQGFYRSVEHPLSDSRQIEGWQMPIGRFTSARQQWETHWASLWEAIPQIMEKTVHRIRFSASGQDAFVCIKQQLYDTRTADVYCWSAKLMSSQLLVAIRDWTYKQGYRTLVMAVDDKTAKVLGDVAEPDPYHQQIFARTL